MKTKLTILSLAAMLCFTAAAQTGGNFPTPPAPTNAPPADVGGFLTTALGYVSSFSDLQTFQTNDSVDIWSGAEYVNNQHTAVCLGLSYNTSYKPLGLTLGIESVTRNAPGLAGTAILSQNVGVNLQKIVHDVKFVGYVSPGYDFDLRKPNVEIGARVFKALTSKSAMGIGIGERIGGGKISAFPTLSVFALIVPF